MTKHEQELRDLATKFRQSAQEKVAMANTYLAWAQDYEIRADRERDEEAARVAAKKAKKEVK